MYPPPADVTNALCEYQAGRGNDSPALPYIYQEIRRIAHRYFRAREFSARTFGPTDVAHQVWPRLLAPGSGPWHNRAHFFAAAAKAIRDELIDRARRRNAAKRGGGQVPMQLNNNIVAVA